MAKTAEEARAHIPPEQLRDPVAKLRVVHLDERNALGAKHRKGSLDLRSKHDAARAKDRALSNGAVVTHEWIAKEAADRRELEPEHADQRSDLATKHRDQLEALIKKTRPDHLAPYTAAAHR